MAYPERGRMRVLDSLNASFERTRTILFQPFQFGVWIQIGLIAFLASLGQSQGMGSGGFNFQSGQWPGDAIETGEMRDAVEAARAWFAEHTAIIIMVVSLLVVVGLAFMLLLQWLSSRGEMMMIRAVALGYVDLGDHWRETGRPAWSLFKFRVVLLFIGGAVSIALLIMVALSVWPLIMAESSFTVGALLVSLIPVIVIGVFVFVFYALISFLLHNFVAPLMVHLDLPCMQAWGHFLGLIGGNVLPLAGFLGLKIVVSMGYGVLTMFAGCLTLCIGFLPIIHHTIFAPYFVFERALSLYMLQSMGPEYDMIFDRVDASPEPPPPPLPERMM